jgi:hypothetical protein
MRYFGYLRVQMTRPLSVVGVKPKQVSTILPLAPLTSAQSGASVGGQ